MKTIVKNFQFWTSSMVLVLLIVSCTKEDNEYTLNHDDGFSPSSLIYFKGIDLLNVEADGVSYSTILVQIHPETDAQYRQVSLKTTVGKFANGRMTDTIAVNASGQAYFTISSNVPKRAMIRAMVRTYSVDTIIDFGPALPDDILIEADNFVIDKTQSLSVSTSLVRNSFRGTVTDPLKVFYKITPLSAQTDQLRYPPFAMSAQGSASITITNPFKISGDFKVEVKTVSVSKDTLRKQLTFRIQ
jgi:hypothetical protein